MGEMRRAMDALRAELGDIDATITLGVSPARAEDGSWSWTLAASPTPHFITVRHGRPPAPGPDVGPGTSTQGSSEEHHAEAWAQLDRVFGPPGFDSGARASVFRELAEGLRDEGFLDVLGCLQRGERATDPRVERARHGLARLLGRGPSGIREGCRILRSVHAVHGLAGILALVGARWRFGD